VISVSRAAQTMLDDGAGDPVFSIVRILVFASSASDEELADVRILAGKALAGCELTPVGLRPPFVTHTRRDSQPDCRSRVQQLTVQCSSSPAVTV
jgi:hypothetical protein